MYDGRRDGRTRADPPIRIMLRPLASPLPLGFFAFGIGSFLFTSLELGWVPADDSRQLAWILLGFVAPLELVSVVFAFLARDPAGAVALGLLGTSWTAVALIVLTSPAPTSPILGVLMLCLVVPLVALAAVSVVGKPALGVVLGVAAARFIATGVFELGAGSAWQHASGWIGLPLVAGTAYFSLALLVEDVHHRTLLPIGRRGMSRVALEGQLDEQVQSIGTEAGVREQL